VYLALARLPEDERAVLELVAVDGLPVKEAAAALGIRPGTARVRLHRARRSARDALSQVSAAAGIGGREASSPQGCTAVHDKSPTTVENQT
jgi:RNA polymerase sigma-70 factor (ECF subfamily)